MSYTLGDRERMVSLRQPETQGEEYIPMVQELRDMSHGLCPHTCQGLATSGGFYSVTRMSKSNNWIQEPFPKALGKAWRKFEKGVVG